MVFVGSCTREFYLSMEALWTASYRSYKEQDRTFSLREMVMDFFIFFLAIIDGIIVILLQRSRYLHMMPK